MPRKYASSEDLRQMVAAIIAAGEKQNILAQEWGVSNPYLSDFLAGKRKAGPKIRQALKYGNTHYFQRLGKTEV
jgi:hypothetical protein